MKSVEIKLSTLVAIIAVLVTIGIAILPVVMGYGELTERVYNLEDNIQSIKIIETRISELEKSSAGSEVSLNEIQKDIAEIKFDLRNLIRVLDISGGIS